MAGFPVTKQVVENETGAAVLQLRNALTRARAVKAWLDLPENSDAVLLALGFVQADLTVTRAAFVDLDNLAQVGTGLRQQVGTNDFFFNARHLTGLQ